MGLWKTFERRIRDDRGAYAILFVIITVAVFTMIAIVIDNGQQQSQVRANRTFADLGMLAGANLLPGNPRGACNEAWTYLIANGAVPAGTASPCSQLPATCPNPAVAVTATSPVINKTVFTFTYPIPSGDPNLFGQTRPAIDGTNPCERMALTVRSTLTTLFGGILGSGHLSAPATAVVRSSDCTEDNTCQSVAVALLLLDPYACQTLVTNGSQAQVWVKAAQPDPSTTPPTPGGPGRITADSDATDPGQSCNGSKTILTAGGSTQDTIASFPFGNAPGVIAVYSIAVAGNSTCTAANKACKPTDTAPNSPAIVDAAGALSTGHPTALFNRVTRAPFDHIYNCKSVYPTYNVGGGPAIPISPCVGTSSPYIDNLQAAIDGAQTSAGPPPVFPYPSTAPATGAWTTITNTGANCSPPSGTVYAVGNYWVNCPGGYNVGGTVTFQGGNVVFQGDVNITGSGVFNFNTNDPLTTFSNSACLTAVTGCVNAYSQKSAFIYVRNGGSFTVDQTGATANLSNTTVFLRNNGNTGIYGMKSGTPTLTHSAPTEGPFKNLGLWTESTSALNLKAQGGLNLQGVFFAPQAQIAYTGQGCNNQTLAQFVSRTLTVSGNGCLVMAPNPSRIVPIPLVGIFLIR